MICPKCGAENQDSSKFCLKCGAKLQIEGEKKQRKINLPVLIVAGILVLILIVAAVIVSLKSSGNNKDIELPEQEDIFDGQDSINRMQDNINEDTYFIARKYLSFVAEDNYFGYCTFIDINEDGIPELLAAQNLMEEDKDDYPTNARLVNHAEVYTFDSDMGISYIGSVEGDIPLCVGKNDSQLRTVKVDSDYIQYIYYTLDESNEIFTTTYTYDIENEKMYAGELEDISEESFVCSEEEQDILYYWKDASYIDFAVSPEEQDLINGTNTDISDEPIDDTADTETETSVDTEEEASTEEDIYVDIEDNDTPPGLLNYADCLDLSNYNYVETDYFSFYCPTDLYEENYITENCYSYYQDRPIGATDSVLFCMDTYEQAGYSEETSPDEIAQELIENFSGDSNSVEILLNNSTEEESDGKARVAISGRDVVGNNRYDAYTIDENHIYTMSIFCHQSSSDEEANWENYYIDCLYRGCSFTRDVGEMDTYEDYLERS